MNLSEHQKKYLRGLGHQLKPTIMVGDAGLSESVLAEYESTLDHHELIKVRVRVGDRDVHAEVRKQVSEWIGWSSKHFLDARLSFQFFPFGEKRRLAQASRSCRRVVPDR